MNIGRIGPNAENPDDSALMAYAWDSKCSSDPVELIRRAQRKVHIEQNYRPNVLIFSRPVFDVFIDHGDVVGRIPSIKNSKAAVAGLLGLDAVCVLDDISLIEKPDSSPVINRNIYTAGRNALLLFCDLDETIPEVYGLNTSNKCGCLFERIIKETSETKPPTPYETRFPGF